MTERANLLRTCLPRLATALFALGLVLCHPAITRGQTWRLVWSDEFDGAKGAGVDGKKWAAEVGGAGWGNREFEYYTDTTKNAHLDGRGSLIIEAFKETLPPDFKCWYGPCRFTSAR